MEIKDWWIARELDVAAAGYIYEQEIKREIEREQRDREFWIAMLGGKSESGINLEESMPEAVLGSR